jgi:hypothetical protein
MYRHSGIGSREESFSFKKLPRLVAEVLEIPESELDDEMKARAHCQTGATLALGVFFSVAKNATERFPSCFALEQFLAALLGEGRLQAFVPSVGCWETRRGGS